MRVVKIAENPFLLLWASWPPPWPFAEAPGGPPHCRVLELALRLLKGPCLNKAFLEQKQEWPTQLALRPWIINMVAFGLFRY